MLTCRKQRIAQVAVVLQGSHSVARMRDLSHLAHFQGEMVCMRVLPQTRPPHSSNFWSLRFGCVGKLGGSSNSHSHVPSKARTAHCNRVAASRQHSHTGRSSCHGGRTPSLGSPSWDDRPNRQRDSGRPSKYSIDRPSARKDSWVAAAAHDAHSRSTARIHPLKANAWSDLTALPSLYSDQTVAKCA